MGGGTGGSGTEFPVVEERAVQNESKPVQLVQLVEKFGESGVVSNYDVKGLEGFRERQETPRVEVYRFAESPENYREFLDGYVDGNFRQLDVSDDYRVRDIGSLTSVLEETREKLELTNFKNSHAFWRKKYRSPSNKPVLVSDTFSVLSAAASFVHPFFLIVTVGSQGMGEFVRRDVRKRLNSEVLELEKSLHVYGTFQQNVVRAEVEVKESPEARALVQGVESQIGRYPYFKVDVPIVNEDLIEAYGLSGRIILFNNRANSSNSCDDGCSSKKKS
ncbi:MAG: hypothetical protein KJ879_02050 [Nanoarchaeota archaeon]|nr:hypothetical protein [Nanoarchaeota archaeon]